ncbi:MAG: AsmA family protein [Filomicrobium sp.]
MASRLDAVGGNPDSLSFDDEKSSVIISGRIMKRQDPRQQRRIVTFAVVSVVLLASLAPLFLTVDPVESVLRSSVVEAADQGSYTIRQPVQFNRIPGLLVNSGTLSLATAPNAAPQPSRARIELVNSGRGVLILDRPVLTIASADDQAKLWNSQAPFVRALADLKFRALLIERGKLEIGTESGRSLVLDDLNLRLRPIAGGRMSAKGSFKFFGRKLRFDTVVGLGEADLAAQKLPIRGTISASNLLTAAINGDFAIGSGGRLTSKNTHLEVVDVAALSQWLGISMPADMGFQTLKATGKLEWIGQVLNFPSGQFVLGGNSATGSLLLNTKGERPLLDGTLAFQKLDVGGLLVQAKTQEQDAAAKAQEPTSLSDVLSVGFKRVIRNFRMPILSQIDVDLRVSADRAVLGDFSLGKTAAAFSLNNGRVLLDLADVELPSAGQGHLQFTGYTNGPVAHCTLRGNLEHVPSEYISALLLPTQIFSGPANLSLDLNGSWATNDDLLGSLNGRATLRMNDGAVLSANLPGLIQSVGIDQPAQLGWGKANEGETPVDILHTVLQFKNGTAKFSEFHAERRGYYSATATGSFDVFGKRLDLNIFPEFEGAKSEEPASVLRINGHWDNPVLIRRRYPNQATKPGLLRAPNDKTAPAKVPASHSSNRG